jgi:hypothetical protein
MSDEPQETINTENTTITAGVSNGVSAVENKKRDSTSDLPMFGLDEAVSLISNIHEKALERAAMPEVARAIGYKHASSTPFYRRMVAARLFGLVAPSGPELTVRARDILKPISANAKEDALIAAVMGIAYYSELIDSHDGKRANEGFIANGIARKYDLTDGCAKTCAKAFMSSLRVAGLLNSDGVVESNPTRSPASTDNKKNLEVALGNDDPDSDQVEYTLYLDKTKSRKMLVKGPISITPSEYRRLCDWLKVTLIIDPPLDSEEIRG